MGCFHCLSHFSGGVIPLGLSEGTYSAGDFMAIPLCGFFRIKKAATTRRSPEMVPVILIS
jgi:hypothetical protein